MKRERISDLYEDFEPEIRIWPYWALGLLIPLVPLCLSFSLSLSLTWQVVAKYVVAVLPLVFTASIMKDGEKAWLLPLSGALYASLTLILWVESSLDGAISYPLGLPIALALSPSALSLIAFSFFLKRKRGKWILPFLLSLLLSVALTVLSLYSEEGIRIYRGIYPMLLVLLSLSIPFVTRRSDSTPWFVFILLILLLVSSSLFHSGVMALLEGRGNEEAGIVSAILGVFVHDNELWYTLTFLFVFSGLSGKSSYRTVVEDVPEEKDDEISQSFSIKSEDGNKMKYTYPPSSSRFSPEKEETIKEEPPKVRDREPERPRYEEDIRSNAPQDDKWYEFIQGGVREERRDPRPREPYRDQDRMRRDDYDDYYRAPRRDPYYREDDRPRRRSEGYYGDGYRDVMVDERRYSDDRHYSDDRDYRDRDSYVRRDERDYRRDDDYYRDRRRRDDNYDDWDRNR